MRFGHCAVLVFACILFLFFPQSAVSQAAWSPISKEELQLKDNPLEPGESAMVLYREVQTDNNKSLETHYTRIKVFTELGKKYADVEIPYLENRTEVQNIQARTVAPDGQSTVFDGRVFDKVMVKYRRFRINAKAFTLPNVQTGSILEYSYSVHWHNDIPDVIKHPENYILPGSIAFPAAQWDFNRELFVRRAHFVLHPLPHHPPMALRSIRLPKVVGPTQEPDGTFQMDLENIPGVHREEYSPPEDALASEVYIFYVQGYYSNENYWATLARFQFQETEKFLAKSKVVREEVARLISAGDSPETKLRKIYERVQQLRFVSFEPTKSEKEKKQENLKPNKNVEEVLTRGYAFANEANLLFIALAREAGFTAYSVRVASRSRNFFLKNVPDPTQLNAEVVEVQLADKKIYLDPATLHCPFGLLPWEESDTGGIRVDQYQGALVSIPPVPSADAVIDRKAKFRLDQGGNLEGQLDVTFLGQEALQRRLAEHEHDEPARKKDLEDEASSWLPKGSIVKLTAAKGWQGSDGAVNAVFEVTAPGFATQAGDRLLFPIAILQPRSERPFQTSNRKNPIYFPYGHQEVEDIVVQLPEGYKVESIPVTRSFSSPHAYSYEFAIEKKDSELRLKRNFVLDNYYFPVEVYSEVRSFYDFMKSNDEEQAVLQARSGH